MSVAAAISTDPSPYIVGQVYDIDPAVLTIGANVRLDTHPNAREFAASIKARGVLEAITAWVDEDGALTVERGQRRAVTAAAVGTPTGTVPVRVIARPGEADRITDQLTENIHRAAMHESETVDAIGQLALLGVSAAQIAKRTAIKRTTVNAAITVTARPETRTRMDELGLTLEQAAIFAEFEDDADAVAELTGVATRRWGSLEHTAQQLRDARAEVAQREQVAATLRAEGLPVLSPEQTPASLRGLRLAGLRDEQDAPIPEEQWPSTPGAAVVLEAEWVYPDDQADEDEQDAHLTYVPVWICTDPATAGLHPAHAPAAPSSLSSEQDEREAEAAREERRRVIAGNKAWRSAQTVRREWLAAFLARKSAPTGAEALICEAVVTCQPTLRRAMDGYHELMRAILLPGRDESGGYHASVAECEQLAASPTTAKAAIMRTLAAVLIAWESASGVHTWRGPSTWDRRIMAALIGWGYRASDIEASILPADSPDPDDDDSREPTPVAEPVHNNH